VLTLYVTPVFFVYMETFQEKMSNWLAQRKKSTA
jgi:hypothetical protein